MKQSAPETQGDEWDFYFSNVNDVLSSLMVNLSAIRSAPDTCKPWLLWIWVHMLDPRDDGHRVKPKLPSFSRLRID